MTTDKDTPYKYMVIEVRWDDAENNSGWSDIPEKLEPSIATTIGFLVKESRSHILIASSYDDININCTLQIPKKMIKSRKEITFK